MYIETLYCSTYSQNEAIRGHMEVKTNSTKTKVEFSAEECAAIQEIAVKAWERLQPTITQELSVGSPAVLALGDYREVNEFDEIPF